MVAEEHQRGAVDECDRLGIAEAGGQRRYSSVFLDTDVFRVGSEAEVGGTEDLVPTAYRVTAAPTAETSPANSEPSTDFFGRRNPLKSRAKRGVPDRKALSAAVTVAAWTRTSTWFGPGTGVSTSASCTTSGGP
nr:hypothetical protein [Phytohabitans flavus]